MVIYVGVGLMVIGGFVFTMATLYAALDDTIEGDLKYNFLVISCRVFWVLIAAYILGWSIVRCLS